MTVDRTALIDALTRRLMEVSGAINNRNTYLTSVTTKETLHDYSDATLRRIDSYLSEGGSKSHYNSIAYLVWGQESEAVVNECLTFFPYLPGSYRGREVISPLHRYKQLPEVDDYSDVDEEWKAKMIALLSVTVKVHDSPARYTATGVIRTPKGNDAPMMNNDDLVELILEHPQDADQIANLIIERNTNDAAQIAAVLESPTKPLSKGTL